MAVPALTLAQPVSGPPPTPDVHTELQCPPLSALQDKQTPELVLSDIAFEGRLQMTVADQGQIAASLKQRQYSGDPETVTSELEETVRRAWQERGYFKVQVHGSARTLTTNPLTNRIAVAFQVDEGQQYRLSGMAIRNNRAFSNAQALRDLFEIKDGDLFNVDEVSKGIDALRAAYAQVGYINFTVVPETRIDEAQRTIWLDINLDEGKTFFVSSINILGLDERGLQEAMAEFLLKSGDIYAQRLLDVSMEHLSAEYPGMSANSERRLDEKAGTVAITITLHHCTTK
jgi:outer membrane protein assembly factor BamA